MDCGKTAFSRVASVRSAANGAWSYAAKPTLNTVYRSNLETARAPSSPRRSRPLVSLDAHPRGRFSASVTAAQSFAGKYVVLQRYVRTRRAWKTVKRRSRSRTVTARHRADARSVRPASGSRGTAACGSGCSSRSPGRRLLRRRRAAQTIRGCHPLAEQRSAKGRSLLESDCYSHKILTARTHLLNVQPVPYIAVKPLGGNRQ